MAHTSPAYELRPMKLIEKKSKYKIKKSTHVPPTTRHNLGKSSNIKKTKKKNSRNEALLRPLLRILIHQSVEPTKCVFSTKVCLKGCMVIIAHESRLPVTIRGAG
jgi:hypothetical protein